MISIETINELLSYNKNTGVFTWKVYRNSGVKAGDVAGCKKSDGYIRIKIFGKDYAAHRLAYFVVYGIMPEYVDHIDRDKTNNKHTNLRACTGVENQHNKARCKNNTSGRKGVTWHKKSGKWQAQSRVDGKSIHLGTFSSLDEASNAYKLFCKENHGEFYAGDEA